MLHQGEPPAANGNYVYKYTVIDLLVILVLYHIIYTLLNMIDFLAYQIYPYME